MFLLNIYCWHYYSANDATAALLKNNKLTESALKQAIKELRKGQTVNNPSADTTYNSLDNMQRI